MTPEDEAKLARLAVCCKLVDETTESCNRQIEEWNARLQDAKFTFSVFLAGVHVDRWQLGWHRPEKDPSGRAAAWQLTVRRHSPAAAMSGSDVVYEYQGLLKAPRYIRLRLAGSIPLLLDAMLERVEHALNELETSDDS